MNINCPVTLAESVSPLSWQQKATEFFKRIVTHAVTLEWPRCCSNYVIRGYETNPRCAFPPPRLGRYVLLRTLLASRKQVGTASHSSSSEVRPSLFVWVMNSKGWGRKQWCPNLKCCPGSILDAMRETAEVFDDRGRSHGPVRTRSVDHRGECLDPEANVFRLEGKQFAKLGDSLLTQIAIRQSPPTRSAMALGPTFLLALHWAGIEVKVISFFRSCIIKSGMAASNIQN